MRVQEQPAFVLHTRPYRETSVLLDCFTRDYGRVGLVARGVRRERARLSRSMLQPLQPLLLNWIGKGELGTLVSAESIATSFRLVGDNLFSAMYVNELVLRLTENHDPHPATFDAYMQCLSRLAVGENTAWTLRRFEREFFQELGYGLVLEREVENHSPICADTYYTYHPELGPKILDGQTQGVRISGSALLALAKDIEPPLAQLEELRRLMRMLIRHQLGGGVLNSWGLSGLMVSIK